MSVYFACLYKFQWFINIIAILLLIINILCSLVGFLNYRGDSHNSYILSILVGNSITIFFLHKLIVFYW